MNTDKNIGRRTALKVMGAFAANASMSALGFASYAAENSPKKDGTPRRIVFYFTATGNSLYVARALSPEPVSIPQALKEGNWIMRPMKSGLYFPTTPPRHRLLSASSSRKHG